MTAPSRDRSKDLALIGTTIAGKYRVLQLLGQGGFGSVFLVEIVAGMVGEKLALKLIPSEVCADEKAESQFLNEIRVAMRMVNKYIVQVRDVGQTEAGQLYYTMDYCPGETFAEVLKREGKIPPGRAIPHVLRVLEALKTAHAAGVIHRDLKPANVMVFQQEGHETCRVLDFGIATAIRTGQASGGTFVGSPHYMPPEQFLNEQLGFFTDTYSVGVILYECLTGQKPYRGKTAQEVYNDLKKRPVVPPEQINPELASYPGLSRVTCRALERNPDLRYQTAKDFFAELKAVLEGKVEAPPPAPAAAPRRRRSPVAVVRPAPSSKSSGAAIGIAAGIMVLVVAIIIIMKGSPSGSGGAGSEPKGPGPGVAAKVDPAVPPTPVAPPETVPGAGEEPAPPPVEPTPEVARKDVPEVDAEARRREDAEKAKVLIVQAADAAKEKNWEKAREHCIDAIALGHEGPESMRLKGLAELRLGFAEDALKSLAEARNRTHPEKVDLDLLLFIIEAYAAQTTPDRAAIGRILGEAVETWKRRPEDAGGAGPLLRLLDDNGEEAAILDVLAIAEEKKIADPAVAEFRQKYLVLIPKEREAKAQAILKDAKTSLDSGDFAQAATRAEEGFGLARIPDLGFVLAEAYEGLGKRKEMMATIGEVAKTVKGDSEGIVRVGLFYGRAYIADHEAGGRKEKTLLGRALQNLDAAVEVLAREPKNKYPQLVTLARSYRARCHALLGNAAKVEEDISVARSAGSTRDGAIVYHQAETFFILGEKASEPDRSAALKSAISRIVSYKELKEGAKDPKASFLHGLCYLRMGVKPDNFNKASTSFAQALSLGMGDNPDLYDAWAEAYKGTGDYIKAGQRYRTSFELRPTEEVCASAAKCFIEANNPRAAKDILRQGIDRFPQSAMLKTLLQSLR